MSQEVGVVRGIYRPNYLPIIDTIQELNMFFSFLLLLLFARVYSLRLCFQDCVRYGTEQYRTVPYTRTVGSYGTVLVPYGTVWYRTVPLQRLRVFELQLLIHKDYLSIAILKYYYINI